MSVLKIVFHDDDDDEDDADYDDGGDDAFHFFFTFTSFYLDSGNRVYSTLI